MPKSLSELRAPGDSSNSLFYIHFALRKFVFFSCGMKRVRSVNRHIFILGALRESIVQHQKHFIKLKKNPGKISSIAFQQANGFCNFYPKCIVPESWAFLDTSSNGIMVQMIVTNDFLIHTKNEKR